MKKKKIRKKIAEQVLKKINELKICPNERDIILNIILPKKDNYIWYIHCDEDCTHKNCANHYYDKYKEYEKIRKILNKNKEKSNA